MAHHSPANITEEFFWKCYAIMLQKQLNQQIDTPITIDQILETPKQSAQTLVNLAKELTNQTSHQETIATIHEFQRTNPNQPIPKNMIPVCFLENEDTTCLQAIRAFEQTHPGLTIPEDYIQTPLNPFQYNMLNPIDSLLAVNPDWSEALLHTMQFQVFTSGLFMITGMDRLFDPPDDDQFISYRVPWNNSSDCTFPHHLQEHGYNYGWATPSEELVQYMVQYILDHNIMKVIDPFCGNCLMLHCLALELQKHDWTGQLTGCDIKSYPTMEHYYGDHPLIDFQQVSETGNLDIIQASDTPTCLFLGWPHTGGTVIRAAKENPNIGFVVYQGEWNGCTGDDELHEQLDTCWNRMTEIDVPCRPGIWDKAYVYEAKN